MIKIILAIDGLKFSHSSLDYAIEFARQAGAHLTGFFLNDVTYHSYKIFDPEKNIMLSTEDVVALEGTDKALRMEAVRLFETACVTNGLNYNIQVSEDIAISSLLHESIYSDMLVINSEETFTHYSEARPTRFIRQILEEVQCPVLLAPRQFIPTQKIVFLYDGAPASVYAIKMLNYLCPPVQQLPIEIITVEDKLSHFHLQDYSLMQAFIEKHFTKVSYTVLNGHPDHEIVAALKNGNEGTLVVTGAYTRTSVSRWFKTSMADILMSETELPLFIAHSNR